MDLKLEVVIVPVTEVNRAKQFYGTALAFREDIDVSGDGGYRAVQMTPTGSPCSIIFGSGVTSAAPGSLDRLLLAVDDIEKARAELVDRGVDVSEIFHDAAGGPGAGFVAGRAGRCPGPGSSRSLLRLVRLVRRSRRQRLVAAGDHGAAPGPGVIMDVAALAALLHETAEHHGTFEAIAPPHDWWDWYAAYMATRQGGAGPDDAAATAGRYMAEVLHVVASPARERG